VLCFELLFDVSSSQVWNKMDLLPPERQRELLDEAKRSPPSRPVFPLSALLGLGMPELIAFLDKK
jgi:50S ribosomal subunit-associated GTPase HflX